MIIQNPNIMKTRIKALLIAVIVFLMASCEKEDNPKPKNTAEVIYSDWFALDTAFDKFTPAMHQGTTEGLVYKFKAPITQDILDYGIVLFYFRGTNNDIYPFPVVNYGSVEMAIYHLKLNEIAIVLYTRGAKLGGSDPVLIVEDEKSYRYIIIPGGVAASARANGIGLGNFNEVAKAFNIPN